MLHNTTWVMVLSYDSEFISSALLWDMVGFKTLRHRFTERKTDPRESIERKKERKKEGEEEEEEEDGYIKEEENNRNRREKLKEME